MDDFPEHCWNPSRNLSMINERYQVDRLIGKGSFGNVYQLTDT